MYREEKHTGLAAGIAAAIIFVFGMWWLAASRGVDLGGLSVPLRSAAATSSAEDRKAAASRNSLADRSASDVVSIVRSLRDGTEFSSLLRATGVASQIRATGQYTVFVPLDSALSAGSLTAEERRRLAQHHVVSGSAIDADAMHSGFAETLSRDSVNFTIGADGAARVGSARIIRSFPASNGIVYLLSDALIPPQKNPAF